MKKYHNQKVKTYEGTFDSKREYERWVVLKLMQREGKIHYLKRQVPYVLIPSQKKSVGSERPVKYIADFVYEQDGVPVVEDTKGVRTADYIIKRKLMLQVYGIEIKEL